MRKRPLANLNNGLLDRLVRTGLLNICFTDRQKLSLLHVAGQQPPPNLFNQSMLELNLVAVGQATETPPVAVLPFTLCGNSRLQTLVHVLTELLHPQRGELGMTMRGVANAELAIISKGLTRVRTQGELMRVVGAKIVDPENSSGERASPGGVGMNISHHRLLPEVGLSQVIPCKLNIKNPVIDSSFVIERSGTLLERLIGQKGL